MHGYVKGYLAYLEYSVDQAKPNAIWAIVQTVISMRVKIKSLCPNRLPPSTATARIAQKMASHAYVHQWKASVHIVVTIL